MNLFGRIKLQHIYRERNAVADCLATWSHNLNMGCCFFEESPGVWSGVSALPRGTERKHHKEYEEVCAPAGAGKTNIAMISILHEIAQHFKDGYLHKD
ncbi:unnamed protein product [Prunus armeniaca]|uniref:Uncharacterized protein n=1 Tax=Prunus armeniaca TaxID=36596 RepID=A0A6J5WJ66_PRUAR|nr:unnamed protein product [Prunus armeniaca]